MVSPSKVARRGEAEYDNIFEGMFNRRAHRHQANHDFGPIYDIQEDSFILGDNSADPWNRHTNPDGIVPIVVHPQLIKGRDPDAEKPLTDEQKEGLQYLWQCIVDGDGGILAHDMGLGKTRTGISLILTLLEQSAKSKRKSTPGANKCIIIAPKNAVDVWNHEFTKWAPSSIPYKSMVIKSGDKSGWDNVDKFIKPTSFENVLILSYETFLKYNTGFENAGFAAYPTNSVDLVICDEAHVLKNDQTNRVKNLNTFKAAKLWLGFTGTPFQNNLVELCNLIKFFRRRGELSRCNYRVNFCKPITEELQQSRRLVTDRCKALLHQLREIVRDGMHFRLNNSLNIEKHEMTLCIPLQGHPNYYDNEATDKFIQHKLYKMLTEVLEISDITFFERLSYFHKACIHPKDLRTALNKNPVLFAPLINLYDQTFQQNPVPVKYLPMFSAKISVVAKMAQFLKANLPEEKMVIVSNSVVLLTYVRDFLDDAHGIRVVVYDGEKSEGERARCLRTFETDNDIQIMLLSLKAGGTALTLTRANHLVLMDPDYNPANDRQALGRIYRPTQERPVYVYRLLATGTLEESKYIHQLGKEDMAKSIRPDGQENVQAHFREGNLLKYYDETKSHIQDLLDKCDIDNFNLEEVDELDGTFAEEIKNSKRYWQGFQIPDNLQIVKEIADFISYVYHIPKIPDLAEQLVLADLDPAEELVMAESQSNVFI